MYVKAAQITHKEAVRKIIISTKHTLNINHIFTPDQTKIVKEIFLPLCS
jgi:hypothetical protein